MKTIKLVLLLGLYLLTGISSYAQSDDVVLHKYHKEIDRGSYRVVVDIEFCSAAVNIGDGGSLHAPVSETFTILKGDSVINKFASPALRRPTRLPNMKSVEVLEAYTWGLHIFEADGIEYVEISNYGGCNGDCASVSLIFSQAGELIYLVYQSYISPGINYRKPGLSSDFFERHKTIERIVFGIAW